MIYRLGHRGSPFLGGLSSGRSQFLGKHKFGQFFSKDLEGSTVHKKSPECGKVFEEILINRYKIVHIVKFFLILVPLFVVAFGFFLFRLELMWLLFDGLVMVFFNNALCDVSRFR